MIEAKIKFGTLVFLVRNPAAAERSEASSDRWRREMMERRRAEVMAGVRERRVRGEVDCTWADS